MVSKHIVVSAPGKIHLMGEHAVVYGKPALLSAVNLRLTVRVSFSSDQTTQSACILQAVEIIKDKLQVTDIQPIRISISSDIPSGFHLGSSAALAVALTGALMKLYTEQFDRTQINDIAYELEKLTHGTPSGGDNTTVTYGGSLWFQKKSETEKVFTHVSFPPSDLVNHFFLINTGKPESTKDMVALVRSKVDTQTSKMEQIFKENEKATMMVKNALETSDEHLLIDGICTGEKTLEDMGVVSDTVKPLIRAIEQSQGAAKILGGGGQKKGVGFLLCYSTDIEQMKKLVSSYGYAIRDIVLGEEGVREEKSDQSDQ